MKDDILTAESLINQGFLEMFVTWWRVCPNDFSWMKSVISLLTYIKGVYTNGIIEADGSQ